MKKILMALAVAGFSYYSAEAQEMKQVCKRSPNNKNEVSCYKTKYADNFPVCKGDYGYSICGEVPTMNNSTSPRLPMTDATQQRTYPIYEAAQDDYAAQQPDPTVPQSQSYAYSGVYGINVTSSYEGYFPSNKGKIRVRYNTVAEDTRAPYEGLPSQQWDGPEKNNDRNLNVSSYNNK